LHFFLIAVVKRDKAATDACSCFEPTPTKKLISHQANTFTIPYDTHALGANGVRNFFLQNKAQILKDLQTKTGAKIDIDKDESKLVISGEMGPMIQATQEIQAALDSMNNSVMVTCDGKQVGNIIGKGGENIKRLQAETGATINTGEKGTNMITIAGTPKVGAMFSVHFARGCHTFGVPKTLSRVLRAFILFPSPCAGLGTASCAGLGTASCAGLDPRDCWQI
jgi:hypothetical protein